MNSIDNNIQFTYEIENNVVLPFLDILVSRTNEGFSTSVFCKNFAVSLPPQALSCHPPSQKISAIYTFFNLILNIYLDPISFNSEIQYLKAILLIKVIILQ